MRDPEEGWWWFFKAFLTTRLDDDPDFVFTLFFTSDYNLLDGAPARRSTSAGHRESETIQAWLPKESVFFTALPLKLN